MMEPQEYLAWCKYKMGELFQPERPIRMPCNCSLCVRHEGGTMNGKKQHICDYKNCNKLFPKVQQLRNHMRSHLGEGPYGCCFCEKRFYRHEELTRHKRGHTKEKIYACPQCTKGFKRLDCLSKHMDMHKKQALESKKEGEAVPTVSHPECDEKQNDGLTIAENNGKDNEQNKATEDN